MATPEGLIQNAICLYLETRTDLFFWVSKTQGTYDPTRRTFRKMGRWNRKGVPDITAVLDDGRMLLIEVKSKTGRLSKEQKEFHKKVEELGAMVIVARSVEDVKNRLDASMMGDPFGVI